MSVVIGFDQGKYTPIADTRQIRLSELEFVPTVESLLYVFNYTNKDTYFAQAESHANRITITPDGDDYILEYEDLSTFETLSADDVIHIQFSRIVSSKYPMYTQDVDYTQRASLNSVFGEKVVGVRKADIAAQFQYGYPVGDSVPNVANGGAITTANSMLTVSTGTNIAGYASIANKKALRYIPGHEAYLFFTAVFSTPKADSYQRTGMFDDSNGFFLGYEGTSFCATRRRDGVDVNTVIDISTIYKDGTFDPTKGNIYKISFGYLGFAAINYEVMNVDGGFTSIYKDEYPNAHLVSHILNTNLQPRAEVGNTGNNTDISISTASFTAGVVNGGGTDPSSRKFSFDQSNTSIVAGVYNVITFRSKSTFNSLTNYIQSQLSLISIASDLSKNSVWEFRRNMTITNTPTWTDVDTNNSVLDYSTDAIITAGTGELVIAFTLGKVDRLFENVLDYNIELFPNDTMTIVVTTPGGTSGTFDYALRWKELF